MQININIESNQIEMIASIKQLREMDHLKQKVWGTPDTTMDVITECYIATLPSWQDDVVLADLQSFLEVAGWTILNEDAAEDDHEYVIKLIKSRKL